MWKGKNSNTQEKMGAMNQALVGMGIGGGKGRETDIAGREKGDQTGRPTRQRPPKLWAQLSWGC